jgi:anti-sigma regulatory factor (Ser/Thr protein kinase)
MAAAKVVTNEEESTVVSEEARYEVELPAVPPSVRIARRGVTRFAAGLGVDVVNMTFAVSEAVANVVLHAYRGDADGPVRINALAAEDEVRVIVADQGVGLRPDPGSPGLGLGLSLIELVADHVAVDSSRSGMEIEMTFDRH